MKINENSIELDQRDLQDPQTMDLFQKMMDEQQDEWCKEIIAITEQLGVDESWASDIWYLRTRDRWTQEHENQLVEMAKKGEPHPNMNEWPPQD